MALGSSPRWFGRNVIAADTDLSHFRNEQKLELLAHDVTQKPSYGVRLPTSLSDNVVDACAALPLKHLDHDILLAADSRRAASLDGGRSLLRPGLLLVPSSRDLAFFAGTVGEVPFVS
jgi:hypothetical protein